MGGDVNVGLQQMLINEQVRKVNSHSQIWLRDVQTFKVASSVQM